MTKTIYLVRHGQTFFNFHHKVQGRCDSPLTDLGIRQVVKTREYFKQADLKFQYAYSSTQERAVDTLEILVPQMPYVRLKDLRERDYGIYEGDDEYLLPWNNGGANTIETMEAPEDTVVRMSRAVSFILDRMEDGETALVAGHGEILARYLRFATGETAFPGFRNAAYARLEYADDNPEKASFIETGWPAEGLA